MDTTTLRNRFREQFGTSGDLYFSPGRINLIGEHTDYNGGPLTKALPLRYTVTDRARYVCWHLTRKNIHT